MTLGVPSNSGVAVIPIAISGDPEDLNPNVLLTPDALLAYCESRMSNIDKQIQSTFDQQQKASASIQELDGLASQLNDYPNGINVPGGASLDNAQFQQIADHYKQVIADVGADSPLGQKLQADLDLFQTDLQGGHDTLVSQTEMSSLLQNLKGYTSDLNAGSELNMINLQSLMSQRQTAIQLTTNLVQSLGDQMNKIADNIGK